MAISEITPTNAVAPTPIVSTSDFFSTRHNRSIANNAFRLGAQEAFTLIRPANTPTNRDMTDVVALSPEALQQLLRNQEVTPLGAVQTATPENLTPSLDVTDIYRLQNQTLAQEVNSILQPSITSAEDIIDLNPDAFDFVNPPAVQEPGESPNRDNGQTGRVNIQMPGYMHPNPLALADGVTNFGALVAGAYAVYNPNLRRRSTDLES